MATETKTQGVRTSKIGFAVGLTVNILVICAVLVTIPLSRHDREFNPYFLLAFFNQMAVLGGLGTLCALGDLYINNRRDLAGGKRFALAGIVFGLIPVAVGQLALRIVAAILGWRLQ